jgi:hypothetical protein
MDQPEMLPVPESPRPQRGGRQVPGDDIDLPPIPQSLPGMSAADVERPAGVSPRGATKPRRFRQAFWAVGLLAAAAFGVWFLQSGTSTEEGHPNWQHVTAATEASVSQQADVVIQVEQSGAALIVSSIGVSALDVDEDTTRAVRESVRQGALEAATATLQAAQRIPVVPDVPQQKPELAPGSRLREAVSKEETKFFRLHLFDCCDKDGDIVQVVVNGEPFATVPIMHEGALVSVPLAPGSNTVSVRGIRDGGGGITVSFRTSRGDHFCGRMKVGQERRLEVVVP